MGNTREERRTGGLITVEGTAADSKGGAALVTDRGIFYIDGLDDWPNHLVGKKLRVTGALAVEKRIPDPAPGLTSTGAFGSQRLIKDAKWEEITPGHK
jgi:hypothetical protein